MDAIMGMLGFFLSALCDLFLLVMLVWIILGWLLAFGVVSYRTPLVANVMSFCGTIIEPLLSPFRRFIPSIGGLDITPIFLLIIVRMLDIYLFERMEAMGRGFY